MDKRYFYLGASLGFSVGACVLTAYGQKEAREEKENKRKVLYYLPAAVSCGAALGCAVLSNKATSDILKGQFNASMATPLAVAAFTKDSIKSLRESIVREVGEKKAGIIEQGTLTDGNTIFDISGSGIPVIKTGEGGTLFQEYYTKLYFESSMQAVLTHKDNFNIRLDQQGVLTLGDWCRELKLGNTIPPVAEKIIWESDPARDYPTESPGYLAMVKTVLPANALSWSNKPCIIVKLIDEPNGRWEFA